MRCAYVTLVMRGDSYVPGALVLAHSLRRTDTPHAIVCMVTGDVKETAALAQVFDQVVQVDYISGDFHPFPNAKTEQRYKPWEHLALTQHQCLGLVEYDKVCFLDADVLVLRNMDSIFDLRTPAGTFYEQIPRGRQKHTNRAHGEPVPADYIVDCLRAGKNVCIGNCLLLSPGPTIYEEFVAFLARFYESNGHKYGFEGWNAHINEQMIAYFYAHELKVDWTFVGLAYQTVPWKYVDPNVPSFLYHYLSKTKPWEAKDALNRPWWDASRLMLRQHPSLRKWIEPAAPQNVARCFALQVPGDAYRLRARIDTHRPLAQQIKLLNKKTGVRTSARWATRGELTQGIPSGLSVFQYTGPAALMARAEDELRVLFGDKDLCAAMEPYYGKPGLVALFWPTSDRAPTSLESAMSRLASCRSLVQVIFTFYVPLLMRILGLPRKTVLQSAFEAIHYQAVATAGLEQHVDNVTRTQGMPGPVCSIGFATERSMDMLPWTGAGAPFRVPTMPGDLLIMDSEARLNWSHAVPYDCTHERFSVVIRPIVEHAYPALGGSVSSIAVDQPPQPRTAHAGAFAHYGVQTLLYNKEEADYITWPWDAWERNAYLLARMPEAPVIWDVFAGVGGDAVQFAGLFPRGRITAVQVATPDGRAQRLVLNAGDRFSVHIGDAAFFVLSQSEPCDLLYMDPPWTDAGRYYTAAELSQQILQNVFHALVTDARLVCLKTKFPWAQLRLPYTLDRTVVAGRGRSRYFFHFFNAHGRQKSPSLTIRRSTSTVVTMPDGNTTLCTTARLPSSDSLRT